MQALMRFFQKLAVSKLLQALALILLILVTRGQFLWETYVASDEALFSLSAKIWQHGGIPYRDFFENKPLGVYVFYSLASWFSGDFPNINIRAIHLFSWLWTFLTAWVIRWIGSRGENQATGFAAAILFVLFSTFFNPGIIAVHIEVILLLPLCASMAFLIYSPGKLQLHHSFLAGFFASAAFLCKYQAGILIPIALLYYGVLLRRFYPEWSFRQSVYHTMLYLGGFIPLTLWMLLYLYRAGAWSEFYFWNVFGNSSYIQAGHANVSLWHQLIFQAAQYVLANVPLWILSINYLWILWRNRNIFNAEQLSQGWLLAAWFLLSLIPVSVGKRFEDHYFLFLVPPLSLLSALTLHHWSAVRWNRWGKYVVTIIFLMAMGFTLTRYWMHPLIQLSNDEDMLEYRPYAEYLRDRTQPGDLVFIWGCAPAIYLYADRMPASRFLRTDVLAGRISGLEFDDRGKIDYEKSIMPGTWEKFWEDMKLHPPVYIMDTAPAGLHDFRPYPITQYQPLMDWIRANYVEERAFLGATLYRRVAK